MGSFRDYNETTGLFSRLLYTTVARDGNMKLVISTGLEKNLKTIEKCHTKGSIYAVIGKNGEIKNINVFDSNGNKLKQIDLDHHHNGLHPHTHNFKEGDKYHPKDGDPVSDDDLILIKQAEKLLKEYNS